MTDGNILIITAISIGLIHTLLGPDHYIPFIAFQKSRNWSMKRTLLITIICGLGHVIGSVLLGIIGISFGMGIGFLNSVEATRGSIASWLLIGFGVAYSVWGIRIGWRAREHTHEHEHNHDVHHHHHSHLSSHHHLHGDSRHATPWVLFVIFVLGPCEPLIPLLMYPASQSSWGLLFWVTMGFGITTIGTMTLIVYLISKGIPGLKMTKLEPYTHAIAGGIIALSGIMVKFLGL